MPDDNTLALARAVAQFGMSTTLDELPDGEYRDLLRHMRGLLRSQTGTLVDDLVRAIRYGMPEVWPVSEEGYFDGARVTQNISKAKAVLKKKEKMGLVPRRIESVREEFERMVKEVDG